MHPACGEGSNSGSEPFNVSKCRGGRVSVVSELTLVVEAPAIDARANERASVAIADGDRSSTPYGHDHRWHGTAGVLRGSELTAESVTPTLHPARG